MDTLGFKGEDVEGEGRKEKGERRKEGSAASVIQSSPWVTVGNPGLFRSKKMEL
ncbi:hypothetical protein M2480_002609 [Parabacteroides sp. PFB2-12]|nr:hypothetical protein [Parabacteroides sp. PM6-13]MDH6391611.1 hypothetical protein [Parabacteroides sp. PFB2-12]